MSSDALKRKIVKLLSQELDKTPNGSVGFSVSVDPSFGGYGLFTGPGSAEQRLPPPIPYLFLVNPDKQVLVIELLPFRRKEEPLTAQPLENLDITLLTGLLGSVSPLDKPSPAIPAVAMIMASANLRAWARGETQEINGGAIAYDGGREMSYDRPDEKKQQTVRLLEDVTFISNRKDGATHTIPAGTELKQSQHMGIFFSRKRIVLWMPEGEDFRDHHGKPKPFSVHLDDSTKLENVAAPVAEAKDDANQEPVATTPKRRGPGSGR